MAIVNWEESSKATSQNGRPGFHKWTPGRHRLRFVGRPLQWLCPPFAEGEAAKNRYLAHALVGGELRVVDMPGGLFRGIGEYARLGRDISGPQAREAIISARGAGLSRRYTVMFGDEPQPIPEGLDVEKLDIELKELGDSLESRKR